MERVWKAVHVKGTQRSLDDFNMWLCERVLFTEKCYVNKLSISELHILLIRT